MSQEMEMMDQSGSGSGDAQELCFGEVVRRGLSKQIRERLQQKPALANTKDDVRTEDLVFCLIFLVRCRSILHFYVLMYRPILHVHFPDSFTLAGPALIQNGNGSLESRGVRDTVILPSFLW